MEKHPECGILQKSICMPVLPYHTLIRHIDQHADLLKLSAQEKAEWEVVLRGHITDLTDEEDLAIASTYLFLFLLKTKQFQSPAEVQEMYESIKHFFVTAERKYQDKLKRVRTGKEKKLCVSQLLYYYKLVGYYLTYLGKTLSALSWHEASVEVNEDKIHFLQRQQLLEGNIKQFLSYTRLAFSLFLRKHTFLYTLLSGIGIVLFWHGLWGIYDWVIAEFELDHQLWPYVLTTILGLGVLYILGALFSQILGGDTTELDHIQEMEMEEIEELRGLEKLVKKKLKKTLK